MSYKNAFNCKRCPESSGPDGCPVWWETTWEDKGGNVDLIKSCGFQQLPMYLIEVVKASNRPAAAIESMRNETVGGFNRIVSGLQEFSSRMLAAPKGGKKNGELTDGDR